MGQVVEKKYGQLKVRVVGSPKPKRWIVLCHGYGAPGTDLVPLADELMRTNPRLRKDTLFMFPEAPLTLNMGMPGMDSRAWWHIDIGRFERAIQSGDLRSLTNNEPPGLAKARGLLQETLHEAATDLGLPMKELILGGFSQGAMLTTDLALRMEEGPKRLCILSGTLINAKGWEALAKKKKPMDVFQSHGKDDPILPFQVSIWLRDMLVEKKHDVYFSEFKGGHGIPASVLKEMGAFIP